MSIEIVLKAENLRKSFGKKEIIRDISFEVKRGEIFGFLGPNGSGKTTTIKMMLGLLSIDQGSVSIGGYNLKKNFEEAMRCIGGIIENPDTYGALTGYKNLEIYARMRDCYDKQRISSAIKFVGLENRINDKVKTYSLGMKQRLGLAQAILHKPKVLLLDEPTNGLDPAGIRELRDILKTLTIEEGIAVFVSSHILSEMDMLCDRVCIIDAGRVLETRALSEEKSSVALQRYIFEIDEEFEEKAILSLGDRVVSKNNGLLAVSAYRSDVPNIVKILCDKGIPIYSVTVTVHSLEDTFMEITGGGNVIV